MEGKFYWIYVLIILIGFYNPVSILSIDALDALFLRSNTALVSYSILKRSETRNLYPGLIDF